MDRQPGRKLPLRQAALLSQLLHPSSESDQDTGIDTPHDQHVTQDFSKDQQRCVTEDASTCAALSVAALKLIRVARRRRQFAARMKL